MSHSEQLKRLSDKLHILRCLATVKHTQAFKDEPDYHLPYPGRALTNAPLTGLTNHSSDGSSMTGTDGQ